MARESKKEREQRQAEALEHLRKQIAPGDKVYTSITHVSRSGMLRHVRVYHVDKDGDLCDVTGYVASALGWSRARNGWDIAVPGCGMDMGFHTVYSLGRRLWPDGGPLDKSAPSRQVQERRGGQTKERDGGYLLQHRAL